MSSNAVVSKILSGINIMATFVHNEPTSLGIIQEAGLPEAFYNAIEAGVEPSIEVTLSLMFNIYDTESITGPSSDS
jgi:hypothetical protein